jgi:hypothetical protein
MPYTLASGVHVRYAGVPEKYQSINPSNRTTTWRTADETMHSIFADAVAYP